MSAADMAAWFGTAVGVLLPVAIMHGRSSRFARKAAAPPEPFPAGFARGAYRAGPGLCEPRLLRRADPRYPPELSDLPFAGDAEVLAVIHADGSLTARVLAAPEPRDLFDREALAAAMRHVFEPGTKDGTAVPIVVTLVLPFHPPAARRAHLKVIGGSADPLPGVATRLRHLAEPPGPGLVRPLPTRKVYPPCPIIRAIGSVPGRLEMLAVLTPQGTVGEIEVTRAFDPESGFDDAAVAAVREWQFEPAMKDGVPVPVLVSLFISVTRHA